MSEKRVRERRCTNCVCAHQQEKRLRHSDETKRDTRSHVCYEIRTHITFTCYCVGCWDRFRHDRCQRAGGCAATSRNAPRSQARVRLPSAASTRSLGGQNQPVTIEPDAPCGGHCRGLMRREGVQCRVDAGGECWEQICC